MESNKQENNPQDKDSISINSSALKRIGLILKEGRQNQNMSTAFLAGSLRIGEEQLIALESGDKNLLPEEVFIKAMIRRVSERLGLNSDDFVLEISEENITSNLPQTKVETNQGMGAILRLKVIARENKLKVSLFGVALATIFALTINNFLTNKEEKNSSYEKNYLNIAKPSLDQEFLSKKIIISSLKPTKVSIKNNSGEILFEGYIKKPMKYPIEKGLEIFALRPDLIEIKKEGMSSNIILGSSNELRWHDVTNRFLF